MLAHLKKKHIIPTSHDAKHIGRDPLNSWEPPTIARGSLYCGLPPHSQRSKHPFDIKPGKGGDDGQDLISSVAVTPRCNDNSTLIKLTLGWPREVSLHKPVVPEHDWIEKDSLQPLHIMFIVLTQDRRGRWGRGPWWGEGGGRGGGRGRVKPTLQQSPGKISPRSQAEEES